MVTYRCRFILREPWTGLMAHRCCCLHAACSAIIGGKISGNSHELVVAQPPRLAMCCRSLVSSRTRSSHIITDSMLHGPCDDTCIDLAKVHLHHLPQEQSWHAQGVQRIKTSVSVSRESTSVVTPEYTWETSTIPPTTILRLVSREQTLMYPCLRSADEMIAERPPKPLSTIPFVRDPDYIHRGRLFDEVQHKLLTPGARVALVGLGGVG